MISKEDRKRKIINKRPLVLPDEVNGVTVRSIPKKSAERRKFLVEELKKFYDKPIYCPALKNYIWVTSKTVRECKHRGGFDRKITFLNLNLPLIIKHASFLKTDRPKENNNQKSMNLVDMIILSTPVKNMGFAKLSVGRTERNKIIHYSLTRISLEWLIEKE